MLFKSIFPIQNNGKSNKTQKRIIKMVETCKINFTTEINIVVDNYFFWAKT